MWTSTAIDALRGIWARASDGTLTWLKRSFIERRRLPQKSDVQRLRMNCFEFRGIRFDLPHDGAADDDGFYCAG